MRSTVVHPATARTASGTAPGVHDLGESSYVAVYVNITAISGSGASLTVIVEDSPDGTVWGQLATSSALTSTGVTVLRASQPSQFVRVRYTIAGTTPSITFSAQVASR